MSKHLKTSDLQFILLAKLPNGKLHEVCVSSREIQHFVKRRKIPLKLYEHAVETVEDKKPIPDQDKF
jgi:hypothetical protein